MLHIFQVPFPHIFLFVIFTIKTIHSTPLYLLLFKLCTLSHFIKLHKHIYFQHNLITHSGLSTYTTNYRTQFYHTFATVHWLNLFLFISCNCVQPSSPSTKSPKRSSDLSFDGKKKNSRIESCFFGCFVLCWIFG